MKVEDYDIPEDLYYTKTHEWVKVEGNKVKIGITDYAQKSLRDLVYVEFVDEEDNPIEEGVEVEPNTQIAAVESVKATSEIYSPIGGKVVEVNKSLEDSPETINSDPYGEGWIVAIEAPDVEEQVKKLMNAEQYAEHIKKVIKESEE